MAKKTNPKFLAVTVISLLLMCLLLAATLYMTHFLKGDFSEQSDDIQTFRKWSLPAKYSQLCIFPEEVPSSAENIVYHYRYDNGWTRPMCQIYLSCTLQDADFQAELARLSGLQWGNQGNVLSIRQDQVSFAHPAYVAIEGYDFCYEYALVDAQWNRIVYVYAMNTIERDVVFPQEELPEYYMEGFEDFSLSGLDRFTMYGGYDGEETYEVTK